MHSKQTIGTHALLTLSIVSIIFFVPSIGLATLTVPDDTDGNPTTLQDLPHIGKRGSIGPERILYTPTALSQEIRHTYAYMGDVAETATSFGSLSFLYSNIRGPPQTDTAV